MANQSSRGLGAGEWGLSEPGTQSSLSTQSWIFSAISAASAFILVTAVVFAQLPERARTEALARRAADRMQTLQREADRLASEERTLLGDLRKLEIAA